MPINRGDGFRMATEPSAAFEGPGMIQIIG